MTNIEIENKLKSLVDQERNITREILRLINLAEDRHIHLERGYDSIMSWLIGRYGYSETAARRRANAAKLLRAVPEVDGKIQTGEVNLTTLAKAQGVMRAEEVRVGQKLNDEQKAEVVQAIENKSLSQTEMKLAELFPETMKKMTQQKVQRLANNEVRVSLTLPQETYDLLLEIQGLLGHALPFGDLAQVVQYMAQDFKKRRDPLREVKTRRITAAPSMSSKSLTAPGSVVNRRPSAEVKRFIFKRDKASCTYKDPLTGKVCGSKVRVEIDHVRPWAMGGSSEIENLRCLCRAHNAYRARQTF